MRAKSAKLLKTSSSRAEPRPALSTAPPLGRSKSEKTAAEALAAQARHRELLDASDAELDHEALPRSFRHRVLMSTQL